ncbi:MAG TPA: restriction endonuclease [Verrucomicrobiae bacterium]|nr:restriction endonuclease [Verrucomicrobiae bacterium]
MAEITRRRKGELVRGVFQILLSHPDGLPVKEVLSRLESDVPPMEFERTTYPERPNVRRYERIVRFSTIGPVKAGWLIKNKGLWSLTDEGRKAFTQYPDPERFFAEVVRLYRQWKRQQPPDEEPDYEEEDTVAATTLEEAEESSWSEIESHLSGMNPYDFQNLVAGLLQGMGYHVVWIAPPGPDRGIDVIAQSDLRLV